ncbi:hypothetical protein PR048_022520 [Dryococelus australis]|uniref:Uncharacterized protein n=1 Tax=Dryococelus australis TaxID=614101 RepID=A0ABQ9H198_9NEOP|nr:hypothetical protein PR048_022520 [Dryococelus australis]
MLNLHQYLIQQLVHRQMYGSNPRAVLAEPLVSAVAASQRWRRLCSGGVSPMEASVHQLRLSNGGVSAAEASQKCRRLCSGGVSAMEASVHQLHVSNGGVSAVEASQKCRRLCSGGVSAIEASLQWRRLSNGGVSAAEASQKCRRLCSGSVSAAEASLQRRRLSNGGDSVEHQIIWLAEARTRVEFCLAEKRKKRVNGLGTSVNDREAVENLIFMIKGRLFVGENCNQTHASVRNAIMIVQRNVLSLRDKKYSHCIGDFMIITSNESDYCLVLISSSTKVNIPTEFKSLKNEYSLYKGDCKTKGIPSTKSGVFKKAWRKDNIGILRKKIATKGHFAKDQKARGTDGSLCVSFDLQKALNTPHGDNMLLYYSRKYSVYNFTVYENNTRKVHFHVWGECDGNRGSNEIDSLSYMYVGHSHMPVDFVHSEIETNLKHRVVWAPSEWPTWIENVLLRLSILQEESPSKYIVLGPQQLKGKPRKHDDVDLPKQLYKAIIPIQGPKATVRKEHYSSTSDPPTSGIVRRELSGIEPGSPWWKASALTAASLRPLECVERTVELSSVPPYDAKCWGLYV